MRTAHEVVQAHYDAAAAHDLAGMLADLAPDARWTEMAGSPYAGTWVGAAQIIEKVFEPIGIEWEGFRFELEQLLDAGQHAVAIGSYHGTHRKTGKAMQARVAHVWEVSGGKIVRFEQFADTQRLALAMR